MESYEDALMYDESSSVESDQEAGIMDTEVSSTTNEVDELQYNILAPLQIVDHMVQCIQEVSSVLQLPTACTRILLSHFKWDEEKLMERYYGGDQESLFKEAYIVHPNAKASSKEEKVTRPSSKLSAPVYKDCGICCSPFPLSSMSALECGHTFCADCWSQYLTVKIMDEGLGQTISCAAYECDILVDDATVMELVTDQRVKRKYQHLITNSFVECNKLMRWCPAPGCGHAAQVTYFDRIRIACKCGFIFCFGCCEAWHDPVKCYWLKKWIKKCTDDSETSNWIAANTKKCPKCHVTIEKNGGCNQMICKNQNCKAEFCWICLGLSGSHCYNQCNRYGEPAAKNAHDAQEKSRAALHRYLFYHNRYMTHMQSLKFENKLYVSIEAKMEEMLQLGMTRIEVQFLKKAVDVLCQCRQTLMFTYVFAFYLKKNNQSIIFDDNQTDLEQATELLSQYLEREITSDMSANIKQKVHDKYRYCESRNKVLLDHVHEGYDKDLWAYTTE